MFLLCLSVTGGGVPVVQNFATRCPTDLLEGGGGPVVQNFATRCPTDLLGFFPKFFSGVTSSATSCEAWGLKFFFLQFFFSVSLPVPLPVGGEESRKKNFSKFFSPKFFFWCHFRWGGGP